MSNTRRNLRIAALALVIGAALAFLWSQWMLRRHRWIVLHESIRLEDGFSLSRPFTVDLAATYHIEVECHRTVPFNDLDRALSEQLAVNYAVHESDHELTAGDSSQLDGASYGESISRWFGSFEGVPGHSYRLDFHVNRSLPALSSTQPAIKIAVHPHVFKDTFVIATLYAYFAVALAVISLICFAGSFFTRRRSITG